MYARRGLAVTFVYRKWFNYVFRRPGENVVNHYNSLLITINHY